MGEDPTRRPSHFPGKPERAVETQAFGFPNDEDGADDSAPAGAGAPLSEPTCHALLSEPGRAMGAAADGTALVLLREGRRLLRGAAGTWGAGALRPPVEMGLGDSFPSCRTC